MTPHPRTPAVRGGIPNNARSAPPAGPITIDLPLPPKGLAPNTRWRHPLGLTKATKKARGLARLLAFAALKGETAPKWTHASVSCNWYFPTARRRDADNLLAWLKPYFDGIAEAGIVVNDFGLTHQPPTCGVDRGNPRVEITLTPKDGT